MTDLHWDGLHFLLAALWHRLFYPDTLLVLWYEFRPKEKGFKCLIVLKYEFRTIIHIMRSHAALSSR